MVANKKRSLDLGCGPKPKNPFAADEVYGIDLVNHGSENIKSSDIVLEQFPFEDGFFDYVTAFDLIEHIPRVIYIPERRFPFVELMDKIYKVLASGGKFYSSTPAFPSAAAFQDPTHVNFITEKTFPRYFGNYGLLARVYGFKGSFEVEAQSWSEDKTHLNTLLVKR